ncbi:MAG: alpha-mannosidase [Clostridia bacterium]|nr:alpha-mannosidase [Clostridia bacterium]
MNLFQRFLNLKTKVGGNREKRNFEFTMRPTPGEMAGVTPMPAPINRILSQLNFALLLNDRLQNAYQMEVKQTLTYLENVMENQGTLPKTVCEEAEKMLLPMKDAAKAYSLIYASHAHIDMNWMWGWQETVAVTLSTFRTILNLMNEFPGFTFSQSQASVYKIVEEFDPDMMKEIQQRIREGRWEVTASAWVETDKNMPDTESLIRHIGLTRKYLNEVWGIPTNQVKVDFSPDTFGHSRFVPEINNFGSVPYYYHCRGLQDDLTLYRYRAPSGSEVLVYKEPYWYNRGVNPENATGLFEMERRYGLKTGLIVYGVGNHGGGPTRRDLECFMEMKDWPVFPTMRFGTLHEFFAIAETVRERTPVIDHELNAIFTGCYTTQSRIKLANRRAEAALLDSERMSALAHCTLGTPYPSKNYEKAWQGVLFTHFHDILTGSCVQESREHAMGRLADSIAHAQSAQVRAYEALSRQVDTSMFPCDDGIERMARSVGAGAGYGIASYAGVPNPERGMGKTRIYTVFNPAAFERNETVELTLWDYAGDLDRLEAVDQNGDSLPLERLDAEPVWYWDHYYVRVLVKLPVPSMGYAVCAVREKPIEIYEALLLKDEREELPKGKVVLENERLKATFDTGSGMMHSLVNRQNGEELLSAPAGLHLVRSENGGMTAWRIGRYLDIQPVNGTTKVTVSHGRVRQSVTFEQQVMHSTVTTTISLDEGADALHYAMKVDWNESGKAQPWLPLLTYRLPLKNASDAVLCDVPAGWAQRKAQEMDVPALTGVCAVSEKPTAALITDCKYGFRLSENVLTATLINTAEHPDPYPERGVHAINLYVGIAESRHVPLKQMAERLTRPMTGVPTAAHPGRLPACSSLLKLDAEHCVLTSVQLNPEGNLLIRLYEADGVDEDVTITLPFAPSLATKTNLNEEFTGVAFDEGNKVTFRARAHSMMQLKIAK